ncbi:MAG: efflux RND transporter periplasmic adaptor subunit [Firmicutes bacterium]|nr:efflux RND transporter periplasmic adaptor subunit [Bacillota bacterium]
MKKTAGKRILASLALLLSVTMLGGCGSEDAATEQPVGTAVEVAAVAPGTITDATVVRGNVSAIEDVYVVPKASGVVRSVNVNVGDYVSNGQVLCQLDTIDLQTTLALVQTQYNTLYTNYQEAVKNRDRYAALYAEGAVSLYQYEQAQTAVNNLGLDAARLQVQQVQDQINNCAVKSTANGLVAEINVNPGDMAGSSYVARVVDIDKVKLVANVTENMLSAMQLGMELPVHIDAVSSEPFVGVVTEIPVAANMTMTYPVEITVDNPDHLIMAGMFAEVDVVKAEAADALIIPKTAVNNNNEVYVVVDGIAYVRPVETGMSDDDYVEIVSGLEEGETVVTVGAYLLSDGAAVRIVEGADAADGENADNAENDADDAADAADNEDNAGEEAPDGVADAQ